MWIYRLVAGQGTTLTTFEVGYVQAQEAVRGIGTTPMAMSPVVDVFRPVETYDTREAARSAVHYLNGGGRT